MPVQPRPATKRCFGKASPGELQSTMPHSLSPQTHALTQSIAYARGRHPQQASAFCRLPLLQQGRAAARLQPQQILAFEKSISGCCSMNFLSMSCLPCSSAVGSPAAFCRWSYIIFSTVCRVSPSKSASFEFSGSTFWVLISGSPTITVFHHSIWLILVSVIVTSRLPPFGLSSTDQKESSSLTVFSSSPSTTASCPFTFTLSAFFWMSTVRSFAFTPAGMGTVTTRSCSDCVQL
mmetsp:Transcript_8973/g.21586  ORF Transcript_8973/g.21586 Transcript_8973/m.21586 type:complete len:235 (+) Transcript_8973:193-897(+)